MKLGISGFAWTSKFEERHLRLASVAKEMGFDGFEVAMFEPDDLPISQIRRAFEAVDLELTVCAILPPGINPTSPEPGVRQKSIQHLTRCVQVTSKLRAHLIGGPLYAPIGYLPDHRSTDQEWEWAVEAFQSLGEELDRHEVDLSIEPVNRSETFLLRTTIEAKRLCEDIGNPRVGVTIDTFHANIEEKSIAQAIQVLGPHLKHIHASENDRGILGQGHVDFPAVLAALKRSRYDGYLMIEGFGYDKHEVAAPGHLWADPDVSPEKLARDGMQYLRGLLNDSGHDVC
jgi:D-psicose/D-tagatose/L-ribulose 3-epimerase